MKIPYIDENGNESIFKSGENLRRTEGDWDCIHHELVKRYYSESMYKLAKNNEELLCILAVKVINELRWTESMERLGLPFSKPGTYPEWIESEMEEKKDEEIREWFDDLKANVDEKSLTFEKVAFYFGIKEDK